MTRGLIVAAPRSGSGKTTVTLAVLAALRRRGIAVRAAKSGPDYIDPAFHAAATGRPSLNLDSWAMPPELLDAAMADAADGAEVLVVESAMGLFDGIAGAPGRRGTAADLAARFGLPVVLVLDVSGQSQSAAATARGFAGHAPGVRVAGVVANQAASLRHRDGVAGALAEAGIRMLGCIMRDPTVALPERHLGLVQAGELAGLASHLGRLADIAERDLDLDTIVALAAPLAASGARRSALPPPGGRIALAQDAAFTFAYPHLLAGWCAAGAEIVPFSPLADEAPPAGCDACWLPGGYPELHAPALARAQTFKAGLHAFAAAHPVHGECGGYMVLGTALTDAAGVRHAMAGLLGHATSFSTRRLHLGYREATALGATVLGPQGSLLRGHEYHYATLSEPGADAPLAALRDGVGRDLGPAGGRRGHVSGSFFHVIAEVPA